MKLLIIGILFWHGTQTQALSVVGATDMHTCREHILSENGKPDYASQDKQSVTVFTCVTNKQLHAIETGALSVDMHGNIVKEEEL